MNRKASCWTQTSFSYKLRFTARNAVRSLWLRDQDGSKSWALLINCFSIEYQNKICQSLYITCRFHLGTSECTHIQLYFTKFEKTTNDVTSYYFRRVILSKYLDRFLNLEFLIIWLFCIFLVLLIEISVYFFGKNLLFTRNQVFCLKR